MPEVMRLLAPGRDTANIRRTGSRANDAYTAYLEMGRPESLTGQQVEALHALTTDIPASQPVEVGRDGRALLIVPMREQDVVMIELVRATASPPGAR